MVRKLSLLVGFTLLPLAALAWILPSVMFKRVPYSNSISIDEQYTYFLERKAEWRAVIVGSSEVRWGIDPAALGAGAGAALPGPAFNMGWDGFSSGLTLLYTRALLEKDVIGEDVEALWVGINPTERFSVIDASLGDNCAALQRPVLLSPMGSDLDLARYCLGEEDEWLDALLERALPVWRYRSALKSFVIGDWGYSIPHQSNALATRADGYQPHLSIRDDFDNHMQALQSRVDEKSRNPQAFAPLDQGIVEATGSADGLLDRWKRLADIHDKDLVLFALPTNPWLIDFTNSREVYAQRSSRIADWAAANDVTYLDLGIQDQLTEEIHYSDIRHLSGEGAELFSEALGEVYARQKGANAQ